MNRAPTPSVPNAQRSYPIANEALANRDKIAISDIRVKWRGQSSGRISLSRQFTATFKV